MSNTKSTASTKAISRRDFMRVGAGSAALVALAACAAPPATAPAADAPDAPVVDPGGGTLSVGYAQITSNSHFMHLRHFAGSEAIYSKRFANAKLITRSNDFSEFTPDLAESYSFSEDGTRLTFKLREGLTWHDGEAFDAQDVVTTFHLICLPMGSYVMGNNFAPFAVGFKEYIDGTADSIEGITVEDDYTVHFDFLEPFSQDLLLLAFNGVTIAPDHIVGSYQDREKSADLLQSDWATTAAHVGIGPFRVTEYVADQYIVYEPFENYYRGKPLLNQLIYRPFADAQTLTAALENKEINVGARIPPTEVERLQEIESLKFSYAKSPALSGLNMNNRKEYLNQDVRKAFLHAIDRQAIVDTIWAGTTEVIHGPLEVPGIEDSPNLVKYDYNPDLARELLAKGGWDPNRAVRIAVGSIPADTTFFDAIIGYLNNVGVQVEYQVYGADQTGISTEPYDFDMISSAWPVGYPSQIAIHYDTRTCARWCVGQDNERMGELFDATNYQLPPEEMEAAVWEMQDIISDEAQFMWIARTPDIWGMDKGVQNLNPVYTPYEFTYNDWNMEKVTVEA